MRSICPYCHNVVDLVALGMNACPRCGKTQPAMRKGERDKARLLYWAVSCGVIIVLLATGMLASWLMDGR